MIRPVAALIPEVLRQRLWIWRHIGIFRRPGRVSAQSLWRVRPISRVYGIDRGLPVDRYYIERFLEAHASDIHGRVLEVGNARYTRAHGGNRVVQSDVLHVEQGNQHATIVGDLTKPGSIPANTFDCIILTQTLPFVFDLPAAVRNLHAALKPGGVLLATVPGISKISRYDHDRWGHYWSFTGLALKRLFGELFPAGSMQVRAHGNVLAATAFLHGLARQELSDDELGYNDPDYEVLITLRAVR